MERYDVAFIGSGANPETQDNEGLSMAYRHASAQESLDECTLVAAADVVPENAAAFAENFGIDDGSVYEEYHALLEEIESDIVSVCTPPHTHADIVVDSAETGSVEAIHCEKPMARRWADCERMVTATDEAGVNLTFNHQRWFGAPYRTTERLLDDGEIGDLERVEMPASAIRLTSVSRRSGGKCSGK